MEQKIQQEWLASGRQQEKYYSAASVGRLEGSARASADNAAGDLSLINGGVKVAGYLAQAYDKGAFKFGGGDGGPGAIDAGHSTS